MSQPLETAPREHGRLREIFAICMMALGVFVLVSLHTTASGAVGAALGRALKRVFGHGADIPALFAILAGAAILRQSRGGRARRSSALLLIYLVLLTGYHLIVTEIQGPLSPYWAMRLAEEGGAGGLLGGFLGARLLAGFGSWGSLVVLVALLFVGIALYLETPVSRLVSAIVRGLARLIFGGARGVAEFFAGVAQEVKELVATLRDRRERAQAEEAMRRAASRRTVEAARAGAVELRQDEGRDLAESGEGGARRGRRLGTGLFGRRSTSGKMAGDDAAAREAAPVIEAAPEESVASPAEDLSPPEAARSASPERTVRRRAEAVNGPPEDAGAAEPPVRLGLPTPATAYTLPATALLNRPKENARRKSQSADDQSRHLEETLATFGVQAKVVRVSRGPVVTRYELQPAPGIKVSKIVNLADDVALNLAAADVRIEAPVPGKSVVGIEVPNKETTVVTLRETLESPEFQNARSKLVVGLGKDIAGNAVVADLTKLLHVLIAGATGSGKSVCINTIICSLLYKAKPDEVKLLMIDPKRVELAVYDGIPHLITPVVTDPKLAANALRWAVKEMESRYKKFSEAGVRNIDGYNQGVREGAIEDEAMPYLVVIIDELADLMLVAQNEVEDSICRLAQMARAAGIHLVIATQRPSVDVITGLIKANVPSRISFAVSSGIDSRTILDMVGAERLIGKGDMLYYPIGANKPLRVQGAWISDKEVQGIAAFWKKQGEPEYAESVTEAGKPSQSIEDQDDELYRDAVQLVVETGNASISMIQRRFRVGYARAARLIDMMELNGIVGPYQGSKPREVLRTIDDLEELAQ